MCKAYAVYGYARRKNQGTAKAAVDMGRIIRAQKCAPFFSLYGVDVTRNISIVGKSKETI